MTRSASEIAVAVGFARVAIVLAGGASRRFGADKLAADLDGATLLDTVLAGLPAEVEVIVVGPPRPVVRAVRFVCEQPAGGGPAAGLVAGLEAALAGPADIVWVLPGDAPGAGAAAAELDHALVGGAPGDVIGDVIGDALADVAADITAVVAVDGSGRRQPLQLALRRSAAEQLVERAGPDRARHAPARGLVESLDPPARSCAVAPAGAVDIDTPEQLREWRGSQLRNVLRT